MSSTYFDTGHDHATAFHEAGHAVLAKQFGFRIDHVGYSPVAATGRRCASGYMRFSKKTAKRLRAALEDSGERENRAHILSHVVVAMAGAAAAMKAQGNDFFAVTDDSLDRQQCLEMLSHICDLDDIAAAAEACWAKAVELVETPSTWRAISHTAGLLMQRGALVPTRLEDAEIPASLSAEFD